MSRKRKLPPGTWVERDLFESKAFLSLRGFAPQLLILLLGKRQFKMVGNKGKKRWCCTNCQSLTITYIELRKQYGITVPRVTRAIDDLLAKGFVEIYHQGGRIRQDRNIYSLSDKWTLWVPGMVFSRRKRDVKRGYQGGKRNICPKGHRAVRGKQAFLDRAENYDKTSSESEEQI